MKLFPWIPTVEIVEWQDRLGIWVEAPEILSDNVQTPHGENTHASDFDDDAEETDNVHDAFTWSFSVKK